LNVIASPYIPASIFFSIFRQGIPNMLPWTTPAASSPAATASYSVLARRLIFGIMATSLPLFRPGDIGIGTRWTTVLSRAPGDCSVAQWTTPAG